MAAALRNLPRQNLPADVIIPGLLEGLSNVARLAAPWVEADEVETSIIQSMAK